MSSVFKKLIEKEFGHSRYNMYYSHMKKVLEKSGTLDIEKISAYDEPVLHDMDEIIRKKGKSILAMMYCRLNETFYKAVRINRGFFMTVIVYILAMLILLLGGFEFFVALPGAVILTLCFGYKLYEFMVNKFCYVDVKIILAYKKVLERLIGDSAMANED